MTKFLSRFIQDDSIAKAIEFGLITALIAIVSISAITTLGLKFSEMAEVAAAGAPQ